jgi:hypothetical protein
MTSAVPSPDKLQTTPTVGRPLAEELPEALAATALEFITGPLPENPERIGHRLSPPLDNRNSARRGTYRSR